MSELDDFDKLLQDFIDNELKDVEEGEQKETVEEDVLAEVVGAKANTASSVDFIADATEIRPDLAKEERALVKAWSSYTNATTMMAATYGQTTIPEFCFSQQLLLPRYKPNVVEAFTRDTLLGWVIILETYPNQASSIHPNSSDEQILGVAEKTSDPLLQDALISYVEILIELEACDIAYQTRLIEAKKKHLSKKVYEEHNLRREKIYKYIEELEKKKFPINAHNLITNYFKVAARDPDGAWETLTTNPAIFAPIELDKIPKGWFNKKPKPEDGFKWNKKIAAFLKKLKIT